MEGLKPPQTLCLDSSNLPKMWKNWREEFVLYVDLTMAEADDKQKVKLFSYLVGESGRELLYTLMGDTAQDAWKMEDIITKFDDHFLPSVNEVLERYRFFTRNQGARENIDSYVTELRRLAETCNFGTLRDSLIRDRMVGGCSNKTLRERLLHEKNLTLEACLQLCRAAELSKKNDKTITERMVEEVLVQYKRKANYTVQSKLCGEKHQTKKQNCPAYVKVYPKFGSENHFAEKETPEQSWTKNVHSSIRTKNSHLNIEKCTKCCSYYHCPFCDVTKFRPTRSEKLKQHIQSHLRKAVNYGDFTIHRCALGCRPTPHYHCPCCGDIFVRKDYLNRHLKTHNLSTRTTSKTEGTPIEESDSVTMTVLNEPTKDISLLANEPLTDTLESSLAAAGIGEKQFGRNRLRVQPVVKQRCKVCGILIYVKNLKKHVERRHSK